MNVKRIGSDRDIDISGVDIIDVQIGGNAYRIEEDFGELRITSVDGKLSVMPAYSNVVSIGTI